MQLKAQDTIYFEKLQRDYENTINYYNDLTEHMESWRGSLKTNEHFKTEGGLDNDIKDAQSRDKNKTTKSFVYMICTYFEKNYGISTLTNNIINSTTDFYVKYDFTDLQGKYDNLSYNDVIKYICDRLKINDFGGRKIEDLRTRITDKLHYYWEHDRVKAGNDKVKISDYGFYLDKNWDDTKATLSHDSFHFFEDIASAYNYCTNGKLEISKEFSQWLNKVSDFTNKLTLDEFYKAHEINVNGLKSVRFYKNGSMEIKFTADLFVNRLIRVMKGEF